VAEILSAGVFIEEVPSSAQVIQGVSTSNMGIVGYAQRGPADRATLVTSYPQFQRTFGSLVKESFLPLSVAAFFANGGRRCYVVRVTPADAVAADCRIQSKTTNQTIETGDGIVVTFTKTAATSALKDNAGATPLVPYGATFNPAGVNFKWRAAAAAPIGPVGSKKRDGLAALTLVTAQANYEGRIAPASLPAFEEGLYAVVRGTVTISYTLIGPGAITLALPVGTGPVTSVTTGVAPNQTTVLLDHLTGFFSIKATGTNIPAIGDNGVSIDVTFTPATATVSLTDDGLGGFPIGAGPYLTAPGTIDYATGAYSFTTTATYKPHAFSPVFATYKINAWDLDPVSKGEWGNDLKVQVYGNPDSFTSATATFSTFNVNVLLLNASTGGYDVVESYEEIIFNDPLAAQYFPDVINELSDFISVVEPGGDEAPGELAGVARTRVLAGGDELAGSQTLTATLSDSPIAPRSVVISFTDSTGTARTITDNGTGRLIGHVDVVGNNTITYSSGAIDVKLGFTVLGGTLVTAVYRSAVAETVHSETFGDTTKTYSTFYVAGAEGTFDSTNWGINQFTAITLQSTYKGLYALNKVDELMQVVVPDFAGDVTVTGQLLDYADQREALPSGGDRFIILTVPKGSDPQEAVDWFRYDLKRLSKWAALYWPWVRVSDPLSNNRPLTMPPMAHIAGVFARTDNTRNVGKSPGGTVDGALRFLLGLEYESVQAERDLVYPNKINPLISSPQTGLAVWGVRTISPTSEWRYINARRLFMFLEKSVFEATHWIVFENNGPGLWTRIKAQVEGFLKSLYNENYFAGNSPAQAFFVIVDETNNPPESIDAGQVIIDVGVAPNKPAEFVRFRFQQKTSS
jgi:phage tail sheath protein FI